VVQARAGMWDGLRIGDVSSFVGEGRERGGGGQCYQAAGLSYDYVSISSLSAHTPPRLAAYHQYSMSASQPNPQRLCIVLLYKCAVVLSVFKFDEEFHLAWMRNKIAKLGIGLGKYREVIVPYQT